MGSKLRFVHTEKKDCGGDERAEYLGYQWIEITDVVFHKGCFVAISDQYGPAGITHGRTAIADIEHDVKQGYLKLESK